jgi:hypothetical protein
MYIIGGLRDVPANFDRFSQCAGAKTSLATRFRRRSAAPRKRVSEIEPFMAVIAELGRLPEAAEFAAADQVLARFGSPPPG